MFLLKPRSGHWHDYFPDLVHDDQFTINFENSVHIAGHAYREQPVIYQNREDGRLHLKLMEWGCIPFYVKGRSQVSFASAPYDAQCQKRTHPGRSEIVLEQNPQPQVSGSRNRHLRTQGSERHQE
jgi:putative SOS response-associated peptidase YedK